MQPKVDQFMHETERTCLSAKIYAFLVTNLTGFWSMSFQNPLASRRGECTKMHNLTSQNGTYSSAHYAEREIVSERHGRVFALEAHPGCQQGEYGESAANQEYFRFSTA
jgi:hypothetical protein